MMFIVVYILYLQPHFTCMKIMAGIAAALSAACKHKRTECRFADFLVKNAEVYTVDSAFHNWPKHLW